MYAAPDLPLELPRGPHKLPRRVVRGSQRRRIVEATAALVSRHGFGRLRVADIASLAGVSRSTFYEQFADKEEVFLASYQTASDAHRAAVEQALVEPGDPLTRIRRAVRTYLSVLGEDDSAAWAYFVEVQIASARTRDVFHSNLAGYAELIARWHAEARTENPDLPEVSAPVWNAVIAGIATLMTTRIVESGAAGISDELLEPSLELITAVAGLRSTSVS